MSSRVLETVLTGRNLLSPVLATVARDVTAFDASVAGANQKAAASATASARAQSTAAGQVVQASARATDAIVTSSARQVTARRTAVDSAAALAAAERASATAVVQANTQVSAAVSGTAATYQRSAASLREKLGLQALDGSAAERSAAANSKAAASAAVFTRAIDGNSAALAREVGTSGASTRATQANTAAREQATIAARAQATAVGALTASNGLLGSSMTPLTAGLGAAALGLGYAAYRGMEFDASMSQVQAASQASAGDLDRLRQAALDAGADTQYSASEAAAGITELAKAGVSTADVLDGGLTGALNLAAAGQMEVADAAEIGATALSVFRLEGDQMSHVADLLAAGAGKAQGSVHDLGMALNQSALVANQTGLSIEDTAGALAMFASNGLVGSDAGTSFKTMLQALTPNSEAAARAMDAMGISAYDAQGNFVGLEAFAGQLQSALAGMTEEQRNATLETIFGADAVRAASVLYTEGAAGVREWTQAVDDQGYAQRQAAQLTDNLKGDLERLGGSVDTLATTIGSAAQGPLRALTQFLGMVVDGVTWAVDAFDSLPAPLQTGLALFAAYKLLHGPLDSFFTMLSARITGAATGMGMAVANAGGFRGAMGSMVSSISPAMLATAGLTLGISGISAGLAEVERSKAAKLQAFNDLESAMREGGAAAEEAARQMEFWNESSARWVVGEQMDQAAASARSYWEALSPLEQAQTKVTEWTNNLSYAQERYGVHSDEASVATERLSHWTQVQAERQQNLDVATASSIGTLELFGSTAGMTTEEIEAASESLEEWREQAAQIAGAFVEPLSVYTQLVQNAAQATADATETSEDSWSDYAASTTVSLDEVARQLEEQILAQENWRENIVTIAARGGDEVANILFNMGEEGAGLVQQMVDATDEDFNRLRDLMIRDAAAGSDGAAAELQRGLAIAQLVGADGARRTAAGIAYQLGLGVDEVRRIAESYGIVLADGVNPVLAALGQRTVSVLQRGANTTPNSGGTSRPGLADGGRVSGPGTGTSDSILGIDAATGVPTAWVSNREFVVNERATDSNLRLIEAINAGRVPANIDPDSLLRLAGGGFVSVASVPRPPSTAPYGPPISTAGDATMQRGYDATTDWLRTHLEQPPAAAASGGSASGLLPIMAAARQYVTDVYGITNIGGFAKRNIIGTSTPSDHSMGKAIDIMTTNLKLGWQIANDFAYGPAHSKFRAENVIWQQSISSNGGPFKGMADRGSPTQNHRDHVHVDTFDGGGVAHGIGYLPKATIAPERVLDPRQTAAFEDWMRSPAAMPGYGMGGAYGEGPASAPIVVQIEGAQITGTLGFDSSGLLRLIDGQIISAATTVNRGLAARGVR